MFHTSLQFRISPVITYNSVTRARALIFPRSLRCAFDGRVDVWRFAGVVMSEVERALDAGASGWSITYEFGPC